METDKDVAANNNGEPVVIYEDADVLVVNKPYGMLVHEDWQKSDAPTLVEWFLARVPEARGVGEQTATPDVPSITAPSVSAITTNTTNNTSFQMANIPVPVRIIAGDTKNLTDTTNAISSKMGKGVPGAMGGREASTLIYYLLDTGDVSDWHRVDAAEVWHWYAGAPLVITVSPNGHDAEAHHLGPDLRARQKPQFVVPQGWWQTATSLGAWTLVGCTVAPGFDFTGFEMAPPDWRPTPRQGSGGSSGN